ncbi:MAG: ATP-binding protein [Acidobacteriota bacterium]|nr:ATP-binding protein [Acidobacteriota bacterium]
MAPTKATPSATQEAAHPDLCRTLAEASPMATASLEGGSHIIRYVNPAFCLLVNKFPEELIGKAFHDIVPAGVECLALLERVHRSGLAETHTGQENSASHPFYWSYAMWPVLDPEDLVVRILLQVTESTPFHMQAVSMNQALMVGVVRQHELMDAAEKLNAQLRTEITERERAEEEMGQFAYAASHDLQEPLRTVTTYTQLLARKLQTHFDLEAEQFVEYIVEGNRRMLALIKDLLAYAQAGEKRKDGAEFVDCGKAVELALASLKGRIEETHAEITSDPLPWVNADLVQLAQVFQNLIGNALKYRKPDCTPKIHIAAESRGDEQVLSVRDNGIGFDPQYAEQIFGIFKRLHREEYPGTGIGLAICKRIVERHHGSIWATGEVGKGATFFFTLPGKPAGRKERSFKSRSRFPIRGRVQNGRSEAVPGNIRPGSAA